MRKHLIAYLLLLAAAFSADAQKVDGSWFLALDSGYPRPYNIRAERAYEFDSGLLVGAGIEMMWFFDCYFEPYLDLRYSFSEKRVSPYVSFNGGYMFGNCCYDLSLAAGCRVRSKKHPDNSRWYGTGIGVMPGSLGYYLPLRIEFSF